MTLVDTSAWVEFLRDTDSRVCTRVDELLDGDIVTCGPIRADVPVLHVDTDFDVLARHTGLRVDVP